MYIPGQPEVNREHALAAAELWGADPRSVEHIGDFGNSVYAVVREGEKLILRLTEPSFRSWSDNQAELEYLQHLDGCGVRVNMPLPSRTGALLEQVAAGDRPLLASLFTYAPGEHVVRDSIYWGEPFLRAWGAALGNIHRASRSFRPAGAARRWHWSEEELIADARSLIPVDDQLSLRELETLLDWFARLPVTGEIYGMTHADFGPRNFNYHPELGITAFDFGNCCYHWYISDLAISLSTLRRWPRDERDRYRDWLLAGYQEVFPIDDQLLASISWFLRLRILYVYLDRLMLFGATPTAKQQAILHDLRRNVHERFDWDR
jgi:Ser/Thr protein kinase RdoA (MazF antagonist)